MADVDKEVTFALYFISVADYIIFTSDFTCVLHKT